jgi:hypothetical protein
MDSADRLISRLNQLLRDDSEAITQIFLRKKTSCNSFLYLSCYGKETAKTRTVSILGIVNTLFDEPYCAVPIIVKNKIVRFCKGTKTKEGITIDD